ARADLVECAAVRPDVPTGACRASDTYIEPAPVQFRGAGTRHHPASAIASTLILPAGDFFACPGTNLVVVAATPGAATTIPEEARARNGTTSSTSCASTWDASARAAAALPRSSWQSCWP